MNEYAEVNQTKARVLRIAILVCILAIGAVWYAIDAENDRPAISAGSHIPRVSSEQIIKLNPDPIDGSNWRMTNPIAESVRSLKSAGEPIPQAELEQLYRAKAGGPYWTANHTFFGIDGKPLAGGFICTFNTVTEVPMPMWRDAERTTASVNPIVLTSDGEIPSPLYTPKVRRWGYALAEQGDQHCKQPLLTVDQIQGEHR